MTLRIEEHLDMADIIGLAALEIGVGQVVEIRLGLQHRHALIIDIEEILQIGEIVGGLDLLQRLEWQVDLIALGKQHQLFRFQAPFQMKVKFCLGQGGDQGV